MHRVSCVASAAAAVFLTTFATAWAVSAPGHVYTTQLLGDSTQSCVAAGPGGTFVALGPGFSAGAQSVVLVSESGATTVVAQGLNSVGDCAYDAGADVLYVTDNGLEAASAVTGDTVFAVPSASESTGLSASGLELLPAGSVPAAASVALDASGNVYVSDSAGGGAGSVLRLSAGAVEPFIALGLDFAAGLAFDAAGDLIVAQTTDSFSALIQLYDQSGQLVGPVSGPTFSHGSYDLAFADDGGLLVTGAWGGDVVSIAADGSLSAFASGLTYATGIDVDDFTGRVTILSSSFSGADEDLSLHRFTPVDKLVAGRGSSATECVHEFYGLKLVPKRPGKKARHAICRDGQPCDGDGVADDSCLFPVGHCLALDDPRFPHCSSGGVSAFEVKAKPGNAALDTAAAAVVAGLPLAGPGCYFSDGVAVAVGVKASGKKKKGKARIRVRATNVAAKSRRDSDRVKLLCLPAD